MLLWFPRLYKTLLNNVNEEQKLVPKKFKASICLKVIRKKSSTLLQVQEKKATTVVSQVTVASSKTAQTQLFCMSSYSTKGKFGYWDLALPANSSQRPFLNHLPFPPTYTRFSATKNVQASSIKLEALWDPFPGHK